MALHLGGGEYVQVFLVSTLAWSALYPAFYFFVLVLHCRTPVAKTISTQTAVFITVEERSSRVRLEASSEAYVKYITEVCKQNKAHKA